VFFLGSEVRGAGLGEVWPMQARGAMYVACCFFLVLACSGRGACCLMGSGWYMHALLANMWEMCGPSS
jgi:hypothetical protein